MSIVRCREYAQKVLDTLDEMQKVRRLPLRFSPPDTYETTQEVQRNLWKNNQRVHTSVRVVRERASRRPPPASTLLPAFICPSNAIVGYAVG